MPPSSRRKITLILAGGASLGSYEAGVLTELIYALEVLNQRAETEDQKFTIDVMTGGSAGALVAVLVARIMLFNVSGLRRNLYNAWVKRTSIVELLDGVPDNALLSKDVVRRIAEDYVVEGTGSPQNRTEVASFAPEVLRLGLTISNMHGMDYALPYLAATTPGDRAFISTIFSDSANYKITQANLFDSKYWATLANTAIASASFPIIFRPEAVFRSAKDFPKAVPPKGFFPPVGDRPMSYLDGGLFNNEPLRDAIYLSREADDGTLDPNRIFLLIDPSINRSEFEATIPPDAPLESIIGRLFSMIFNESRAVDWLRDAIEKNVELSWRDDLIHALSGLIATAPPAESQQLLEQVRTLSSRVIDEKSQLASSEVERDRLYQNLEATPDQFPEEFRRLTATDTDSVKREIFKNVVFILNNAANLDNKSQLNLCLIGSVPEKTAGDQISGFGGFFNEEWRQFDYRQGRIEAHTQLPRILGADYPREQVNGRVSEEYAIPAIWENFASVTMEDADRSLRQELRDNMLDRAAKVIGGTLNVPLSGWVISRLLVRPKVNELLKL
ncbi:MAG: patatin-like phospholipase family protein [Elainellaceae cyanobacterium]